MSQMKELFEKVSNDTILQEKFSAIMNDAQSAGADATKEKLTAFACFFNRATAVDAVHICIN